MTVAELIANLQRFLPDLEVYIDDNDLGCVGLKTITRGPIYDFDNDIVLLNVQLSPEDLPLGVEYVA